jgi:hypothetical protein
MYHFHLKNPDNLRSISLQYYFLNNFASIILFYKQTLTFAVLSQNGGNGRYYIVENNIIGLVKNKQ